VGRGVLRYARLLWLQLRASMLIAVQYRYDFLVEGAISLFYTASALAPLFVIFDQRASVSGWSFGEALLVVGWFTLLQGVLEGAINPSLSIVVEHIRKGTLDFVLLKPADAQFLVSTARFLPWRVTNVASAAAIFAYGFYLIGAGPNVIGALAAACLFVAALVILYSLWIVVVSAAFYVVKVDNLTYLFASIFDAARWPVSVFRGLLNVLFTFVIPLALMTTYPAEALIGRLGPAEFFLPIAAAVMFGALARTVWLRAIRGYTSASS
jgi:ABC-2 type transport system permease protein